MRNRYKNTKKTFHHPQSVGDDKRPNSFLKYSTTFYTNSPESNSDIYVITQHGDRLDNLAYQYYGAPSLWWFIANVNNLNTMYVEAGLQLRIPASVADARTF